MKSAGPCATCGCEVWLPDSLHDAARHSPSITFYCAYGHGLHFKEPIKQVPKKEEPPKPPQPGTLLSFIKGGKDG